MIAASSAGFLDYLRVLAWPVVVVGFIGYVLWRYHRNIGGLIDRISSMKLPFGAGLGFDTGQLQHTATDDEDQPAIDDDLIEALVEARVEEIERTAQDSVAEGQQVIEYLAERLATKELELDYERIYRIIYGSQIAALRTMLQSPVGVPRSTLEAHVAPMPPAWLIYNAQPAQARPFEPWFNFLERNDLARAREDGLYSVTQKGTGFLAYIDALRYPPKLF